VHDLLNAIRAGNDPDVVRKGAKLVLQALIKAEPSELIGPGRYERTGARSNWRYESRGTAASHRGADHVEMRIPKLHHSSFFPSIMERRRSIEPVLFAM
jgi:transposase-like protein